MKKKVLAVLLSCTLAMGLAACGSGSSGTESAAGSAGASEAAASAEGDSAAAAEGASEAAEDVDYGTGNITIWVAEEVTSFTQTYAEKFLERILHIPAIR